MLYFAPEPKPLTQVEKAKLQADYNRQQAVQQRYEAMLKKKGIYICSYCHKQNRESWDGLCVKCWRESDFGTAASEANERARVENTIRQAEIKGGIY